MSLNKVMLIGNLGKDPEIRYSHQGTAMVNFSIATSEKWKDKNSGQQQEKTEWHKIKMFGKPAEVIEKYARKGTKLFIEGSLETRSYEKDGQTHYMTEIKAFQFQFLGGKKESEPAQNNQGYQEPIPDDDIPF